MDQMQRREKIVKFASSSCLNAEGAPPRYKKAAVSGLSSLCGSVLLQWKNVLPLDLGPLNLKQCDAFVVFVYHYPENPKMTTRTSTWLHAPSVTFCSEPLQTAPLYAVSRRTSTPSTGSMIKCRWSSRHYPRRWHMTATCNTIWHQRHKI